jgi:hypothetical protein
MLLENRSFSPPHRATLAAGRATYRSEAELLQVVSERFGAELPHAHAARASLDGRGQRGLPTEEGQGRRDPVAEG